MKQAPIFPGAMTPAEQVNRILSALAVAVQVAIVTTIFLAICILFN